MSQRRQTEFLKDDTQGCSLASAHIGTRTCMNTYMHTLFKGGG